MKEQGWAVRKMELKGTKGKRVAGSTARFVSVCKEWSQRQTGPCGWSATGLGMRMGNWNQKIGRRMKVVYLILTGQHVPR